MSMITSFDTDDSALMAKQFAALARSYLDEPQKTKSRMAQIPLENLYRLLEMFRYDAFNDEGRHGVLAIEGVSERPVLRRRLGSTWHVEISRAINHALTAAFAAEPRSVALDEVEEGLRVLAKSGELPAEKKVKVRKFLKTFEAGLTA